MQVLTMNEIDAVSGAADWGQVGAGIASVALGVAIVAIPPVGTVALIGAGLASFYGGYAIGDGLITRSGGGGKAAMMPGRPDR